MSIWSKAWNRWKIIGAVVGNYQGRGITLLFYFTILVPFGIIGRFFADPMRLKHSPGASAWIEREAISNSLEDARRQF